jgi:hypothetical protein
VTASATSSAIPHAVLEVPTATWTTGAQSGGGFCFIAGYEDPFSEKRLRRLYRPTPTTSTR